ncbi:HESO1-like protein [Drosera capensis]
MGDFREPNDPVSEDWPPSSSSSPPWLGHDEPLSVGEEIWVRAERVTCEIISRVRPTVASERRRRDAIDYVQRLIRDRLGFELLPFGSVPLKAYLPDEEIDLTAFGDFELEEALAKDVYSVLEAEDRNPAAQFVVKDVQYVQAEVKLVKCLVQNIVVDISFNQIGGLCTLCFLEQVDIRIGKDHLFKRSIILIKAWCYYESRILGSHHGLISTYALEMLVLYIFHLFHTSLNGPLEVLYKFLDYYSKFDWENFCVTLNGPIHISSLQELMAERAENGGGGFLLGDDFFKEFLDMFSVPPKTNEAISKIFTQKHLNIVDPLKDNNNLGRSVSKASFFRILSAIAFGARKLGRGLSQPEENIAVEEWQGRTGSQFPSGDAELAASAFFEDFSVSSAPLQSGDEDIWSSPADAHQDALIDLTGDYESHLSSWNYGRLWYTGAWTSNPNNSPLASPFQGKSQLAGHPLQFRQTMYSRSNGVIPRPHFVPMSPPVVPGGAPFGLELNKARGTGMYFPNTNHHTYRERSSPVKSPKSHRNNGYLSGSPAKSLYIGRSYEPLHVQSSACKFNGNPSSPGFQDTNRAKGVVNSVDGLIDPVEKPADIGSKIPPGVLDQNSVLDSDNRLATRSFRLKDEEDFPPLP